MNRLKNSESGMALLLAMFLMSAAVLILGALTIRVVNHSRQVGMFDDYSQCQLGLQAAIAQSEHELEQGSDGWIGISSWSGSTIPSFASAGVTPQVLGETGVEYFAYVHDWSADSADNNSDGVVDGGIEDEIRSMHVFARHHGVVRSAVVLLRQGDSKGVWDYGIFGGPGKTGLNKIIDGEFRCAGGVHILGDKLASGNLAMSIWLGALANSYNGVPSSITSLIANPPTDTFQGEEVQTLNAELRVRKGMVRVLNPATIGAPQAAGNSRKETFDAIYVNDGWLGSLNGQGLPTGAYADEGLGDPYETSAAVPFPTFTSDNGRHHLNYYLENFSGVAKSKPYTYKTGNVTISLNKNYYWNANDGVEVINKNLGSSGMPTKAQALTLLSGGKFFLWFDSSTNQMIINGRIAINGNLLIEPGSGSDDTLYYDGKGSIMCMNPANATMGQVTIETNVLPRDHNGNQANTFPANNLLGIMAGNKITYNLSLGVFIGALYSDQIQISGLLPQLAGGMVANYFEMDLLPLIYHVPDISQAWSPEMRMIAFDSAGGAGGGGGGELTRIAYSEQ